MLGRGAFVTRKTSFYYSFLALPALKREAITAVFDFCRAVDDSVDLETDPARIATALTLWRDEISRVFGAGGPKTPRVGRSSRSSGRVISRVPSSRHS